MNEELEKIKSEIKRKKAKWTADETGISKLDPEKRRKRLGVIPPKKRCQNILEDNHSKETED